MRCPGQDTRYWSPDSVFEMNCPQCGMAIEFFKDDPFRKCSNCSHKLRNPKRDDGCASHCANADKCVGTRKSKD